MQCSLRIDRQTLLSETGVRTKAIGTALIANANRANINA